MRHWSFSRRNTISVAFSGFHGAAHGDVTPPFQAHPLFLFLANVLATASAHHPVPLITSAAVGAVVIFCDASERRGAVVLHCSNVLSTVCHDVVFRGGSSVSAGTVEVCDAWMSDLVTVVKYGYDRLRVQSGGVPPQIVTEMLAPQKTWMNAPSGGLWGSTPLWGSCARDLEVASARDEFRSWARVPRAVRTTEPVQRTLKGLSNTCAENGCRARSPDAAYVTAAETAIRRDALQSVRVAAPQVSPNSDSNCGELELVVAQHRSEPGGWVPRPAALRAAASATAAGFVAARERLLDATEKRAAMPSEAALAALFDAACVGAGASRMAFPTVVAFDQHSVDAHHTPNHMPTTEAGNGRLPIVVAIDGGAVVDGLHCDCTRTFIRRSGLCQHSDDVQSSDACSTLMCAVDRVHRRLITCIVPGARADWLHEYTVALLAVELAEAWRCHPCVRPHLEALSTQPIPADPGSGFDWLAIAQAAMPHAFGHGIGFAVHEAIPRAACGNDRLVAGMALALEPGIVLPSPRLALSRASPRSLTSRSTRSNGIWLPAGLSVPDRRARVGGVAQLRREDVVIVGDDVDSSATVLTERVSDAFEW
jgi:Xaa-Pro aminopeptidase